MNHITQSGHHELGIEGSRFIAHLISIEGLEAARRTVQGFREEHPQASHVVWALVTLSEGSQPDRRATDDGEPHGTAGRPLLAVLDGAELVNALAVVIRYFGGQKLGTGGLVRAYGASARGALEAARIEPVIPMEMLKIEVPFALESAVRHEVDIANAILENVSYGTGVILEVTLPRAERVEFERRVIDTTRGSAKISNNLALE